MLSLRMPHILFDQLSARVLDAFGKMQKAAIAPLNPYRPERHYMRGAGPATRAKRHHNLYAEGNPRTADNAR
jgi:hypothetical protein